MIFATTDIKSTNKKNQVVNFVKSTGLKSIIIPNDKYISIPESAEYIVSLGYNRGGAKIFKDAIKNPAKFIYIDNPFFDVDHYLYKRASINRFQPGKVISRDNKRWPQHIKKLDKWRNNQGNHILVLPPSEKLHDLLNFENWLDNTISKIKSVTDRPIFIRKKPGEFNRKNKQPDLTKQLNESYAVITHSSRICIKALIMGIPIYCDSEGPASSVSFDLNNIETNLSEPDREGFIKYLSYCQFTLNEFKNGKAWNILKENK